MSIKVWYLTSLKSKYVFTFDVYCGANIILLGKDSNVKKGDAKQGPDVAKQLILGLEDRNHCVVIDNF